MASGHVNRTQRPNTWLHRPTLQREDSPCQLGAVHTWPIASLRCRAAILSFSEQTSEIKCPLCIDIGPDKTYLTIQLARREGRQSGRRRLMERVRFLRQGLVTSVADGLGIMPVRHVFGLRGARCTGAGEGVQNSRLHPVIPGSAGPGRVETKVRSIRSGAPKGERSRKGSRLYLVTGAVLYPPHRSVLRFPLY
jgi:hypothetical protein